MTLGLVPAPTYDLVAVLEASVAALGHLTSLWRRAAQPLINEEDYSPESVDQILRTWESLRTGAEGGTGGSYDTAGGGKHDRLALASMLADVEQATDSALKGRLHWSAAKRVYARQGRPLPAWRRSPYAVPEPPYPFGHAWCCAAIASALGWVGYE